MSGWLFFSKKAQAIPSCHRLCTAPSWKTSRVVLKFREPSFQQKAMLKTWPCRKKRDWTRDWTRWKWTVMGNYLTKCIRIASWSAPSQQECMVFAKFMKREATQTFSLHARFTIRQARADFGEVAFPTTRKSNTVVQQESPKIDIRDKGAVC